MTHIQLPIPEYRRKGFSLLRHAITLFFKNDLSILFFVAIIAVPIEALKNYYFFEPDSSSIIFFPSSKMDNVVSLLFLSAITPMVVHHILGRLTGASASVKSSLLWGISKWPRTIVYNFLYSVIVVAGIFIFVIPGLLFAVWLMLIPIVVSVADTSRINPMTVSRDLARKRYFSFIGYFMGAFVVVFALVIILILIFSFISFFATQSWIIATLFDVCLDWLSQIVTIVLLLVFLKVQTERNDQAHNVIDQAE